MYVVLCYEKPDEKPYDVVGPFENEKEADAWVEAAAEFDLIHNKGGRRYQVSELSIPVY